MFSVLSIRKVLTEEPVVYVLYVCKEYILSLSVYECRNKAKHVCLLYMCLQCQDNQFDVINYHFRDSCDAEVANDDDDVGDYNG